MFDIRKAVPEDALGITIVNVYTWKTTYSGLIPDIIIDTRIKELQNNPSIDFYKHMGGTVVGQRQEAIQDIFVYEDIIYYKDLVAL